MNRLLEPAAEAVLATPDSNARGFLDAPPDALRYEGCSDDPDEVPAIMNRLMPAGVKVLDIGCGTGTVTVMANRYRNNSVLGVEPDAGRAAAAAARGLDVQHGEVTEAFARDHHDFDVIIFADVLEHLPDPAAMLRLARSMLRPGGTILASVPNIAHWTVRLKLLLGRFNYADTGIMDATHLRWFTTRTFEGLFQREGFDVTAIRHSAGTWLDEYSTGPLGIIPQGARHSIVKRLNRLFPRLFGVQIIIAANTRAPNPAA